MWPQVGPGLVAGTRAGGAGSAAEAQSGTSPSEGRPWTGFSRAGAPRADFRIATGWVGEKFLLTAWRSQC